MSVESSSMSPSLDRLSARAVNSTVEQLSRRISARFPERGLARVAQELTQLADDVGVRTAAARGRLGRVRMVSRVGVVLVLVATLAALSLELRDVGRVDSSVGWLPLIESAINDLVFAAIAIFFLHTLPNRVERGQLLELLHRLRSLAHIVDMHQLTKDPERLRPDFVTTAVSPPLDLDRAGWSTTSTTARSSSAMSGKIWQKISLLPA